MKGSVLFQLVNDRLDDDLTAFLAEARKERGIHSEYLRDRPKKGQCLVTHCEDKVVALHLCMKHYQRQRRTGSPLAEVKAQGPAPYREIAQELTELTGIRVSRSVVYRWVNPKDLTAV